MQLNRCQRNRKSSQTPDRLRNATSPFDSKRTGCPNENWLSSSQCAMGTPQPNRMGHSSNLIPEKPRADKALRTEHPVHHLSQSFFNDAGNTKFSCHYLYVFSGLLHDCPILLSCNSLITNSSETIFWGRSNGLRGGIGLEREAAFRMDPHESFILVLLHEKEEVRFMANRYQ